MATIALNWELGSDFGHIGRFLPIAQALRARGHRPVMLLRDISRANEMLSPYGLEYLQAPLWLPGVSGLPPPLISVCQKHRAAPSLTRRRSPREAQKCGCPALRVTGEPSAPLAPAAPSPLVPDSKALAPGWA